MTLVNPLLGLMALLLFTLPIFIYQAPLLALIFVIFITVSLFAGYKHYRTITYSFALAFLSISYLGSAFVIPGFLIAILVLGFKRGADLGNRRDSDGCDDIRSHKSPSIRPDSI